MANILPVERKKTKTKLNLTAMALRRWWSWIRRSAPKEATYSMTSKEAPTMKKRDAFEERCLQEAGSHLTLLKQ